MSKMKLPILIVLLSALFCLSHSQAPTEYIDVTCSMSSFQAHYTYQPKVVTIRNQIYTVFIENRISNFDDTVHLILTSLDSGNRQQIIKTCAIESVPTDPITGVHIDKVASLGNGKLVIVTNTRLRYGHDWVYNIIIDPFNCSSERTVDFPYSDDGGVVLALIPYHDSYDIFYTYYTLIKTDLAKAAHFHRYNDRGQRIELDYSLVERQPNNYFNFQINTIKPFDASEGYYHSYVDSDSDEIVLQRLDSQFQKVKEIRLKDSTLNISTDVSTSQGHINYCQLKIDNPSCKLLNADLEVQATSNLPKLNFPSEGHVAEKKVINLSNNKGLVVFIAYKHPNDDKYDFYLQWVGSDGSKVETKKIGSGSLEHKTDYQIVDSKKDFCHVTMSIRSGERDDDVTVYNRCLDL